MEKIFDFIVKYKDYLIGLLVLAVLVAAATLVFLVYNSTLHVDETEISSIYGANGVKSTKIEFDDATAEAVRNSLNGMKYDGSDKGNIDIFQTYICVEMTDGKVYHIKYCDSEHVYITKGARRIGRYTCPDELIAISKALEEKKGIGSN